MYHRNLHPVIRELLSDFRIVYLTGPRQSGKSTLVRAVCDELDMRYISLDDRAIRKAVAEDPQGFIRSLGDRRAALDEFQYVPELVSAIKEASDSLPPGQKGKFLLTGSADIFRSAVTQEALPGHMARLELLPLSISELGSLSGNMVDRLLEGDFPDSTQPEMSREDIAGMILRGGYPELQEDKSQRSRRFWYNSYVEGRLFKDFESLHAARGDYRSRLKALMPYLAGLCGNLLKYASVANDLELNDRLSKSYIEMLELMFIVRRVPAWRKNRGKRTAARMPKLNYVDTGLACDLLVIRDEKKLLESQYYGGLFENLIYIECCKQAGWAKEPVSFHHFRDKRQKEVDLVLERDDGKVIGVEVKASATVDSRDFAGLAALAKQAGPAFERGVLIYTGRMTLPFRYEGRAFQAVPLGALLG